MNLQRVVPVPLLRRLDEEGELVRGPPEEVHEEQNHDDERDGSHAASPTLLPPPPGQQAARFTAGRARRAIARLDPGMLSPAVVRRRQTRPGRRDIPRCGRGQPAVETCGGRRPGPSFGRRDLQRRATHGVTASLRQPVGAARHRPDTLHLLPGGPALRCACSDVLASAGASGTDLVIPPRD